MYDLPINNEQLKEIGKISVVFTYLEHVIRMFIRHLNKGKADDIMLSVMSLGTLLRILSSIYQEYGKEEFKEDLKKAINRAEKISIKRNNVVHSIYTFDEKNLPLMRNPKATVKGFKNEIFKVNTEDLREIYKEISEVDSEITSIFSKTFPTQEYQT